MPVVTPEIVKALELWVATEEGHRLDAEGLNLTFRTRRYAGGYAATVTKDGTEYTIWPNGAKAEPDIFPRGPIYRNEEEAAAAMARWLAHKET